ncbi:MAG: SAM-dependent methyltransferase [Deltaproteobacteria bacterium]|nr:SAM-dependent methyltransferase [Deltaproteobacteria bacterium]
MQLGRDVLDVLGRAEVLGDRVVLQGSLDRKLYTRTNDVLEALGGTWSRKARAHLFSPDIDVATLIDLAITTGVITTSKDLGFFPTPPPVAERLVDELRVEPGDLVLEPSAGDGALVRPLLAAGAVVVAVERDAKRRQQLIDLAAVEPRLTVSGADDFMCVELAQPVACVALNPPFLKSGLGDHLDHVRHAYSMLRPGGRLGAIMPSSIEFRSDRRHREFRQWAEERGTIESLPDGSFKASGTGVRTCLVMLVGE